MGSMSIAKESLCGVTRYDPSRAYNGYTLFAPLADFFVWLIDMQGRVVHRWKMPYTPGQQGILLPNGNLLYLGRTETHKGPEQHLGGYSGILLEADWDDKVLWEYENDYIHHDFWRKDNGNTLIIRWYGMMPEDVEAKIKGGLPPGAVIGTRLGAPGKMWATAIQEITPHGKVVWEWKDYEHLDPELDIISPLDWRSEWMHCNSIEELPDGNILISARSLSTIYIIGKATGDVKWRWGPEEIAHQHDATFLENGNILCFDNGMGRFNSEINYSRVVEVNPKTNRIEWEYKDNPPTEFYSGIQAGCQRLPNGNTLITEACRGRIFEVSHEGEIVWEFANPFYGYYQAPGWWNIIYKAYRYGPDYDGFKEKILDPRKFDQINRASGLNKMHTE